MAGDRSTETATLRVDRGEKSTILHLAGRLDDGTVASCWQPALEAAGRARGGLKVDCAGVEYCGGAGFALAEALGAPA